MDDGAGSLEESVTLARMQVSWGFRKAVCTSYLGMERYYSFKEAGVLFQRNVGSLEGLYGEAVSVRCEALLSAGMFDIIGTDLHNARYADFFDGFGFK